MADEQYIPNYNSGTNAGAEPIAGDKIYDRKQIRQVGKFSNTFNENKKYRVQQLSYPSDLMTPAFQGKETYGGNFVVFYINVSVDSKILKDRHNTVVTDIPDRLRGEGIANNYSETQVNLASSATPAFGAGAALAAGNTDAAATAAGATALNAAGVAAIGTQTSSFSRSQKRLSTAIAMHVPNQLSIRYGASWEAEDTDTFAMIAEGGEALVKAFEQGKMDQLTGKGSNIAAAIALKNVAGASAIQQTSGLAPNPRKEQLFKGVDYRTFTFDYKFYPRDAQEAENVMNIIYMFKLHMHPEFKDNNTFVYVYPSEFDIQYFTGGEENDKLHRHTSCVLTEMTVNYTPQGRFTTFENGMPSQIDVTLQFKELALLTKERIQEGL